MPRKIPRPRVSHYMGMTESANMCRDGTWIESETLCYPAGGMTRRAYVTCEDGVKRVVQCGIPDTFFTVPARVKIRGKSVRGFVTDNGEGGLRFSAYKGVAR